MAAIRGNEGSCQGRYRGSKVQAFFQFTAGLPPALHEYLKDHGT